MKKLPAKIAVLTLYAFCSLWAQEKTAADKLGYAPGARLLMIHADDVGLGHSVNKASFDALEKGNATSGSIMVPCPWFPEIVDYARQHPDADLGIHLTLNSEWKYFRWGPVAASDTLSGLVDPGGYLWPDLPSVIKSAKAEEVEREIRAQIDKALKAGLHPTHLDTHMGTVMMPAFLPVYIKVAREYRIRFFMLPAHNIPPPYAAAFKDPAATGQLIKPEDVFPDAMLSAYPGIAADKWLDFYVGTVRNLKPGLTELIVHLGYDDAELQAITIDKPAFGSAWRQRDFDVIRSPEFRKALADNNVTLIGWKGMIKR